MQRYRVFIWTGLMLAVSWLSIALLAPGHSGARTARLGYFLGSLFAHATLAAAWAVFGPGRWIVRVPLSIAWVLSLLAAIAINMAINDGHSGAVFVIGGSLVGQWLLALIPLAGIALGFGLRLRHISDVENGTDGQRFRFGIRDLLIVMAICGVVLALGRVLVPSISMSGGAADTGIFIFLAVAAVVMTMPLLLASLLRRKAVLGVLLALMLIGAITALELPIMEGLGGMRGPTRNHFIAINVVSAALILAVAGVVRLNGYCLFAGRFRKIADPGPNV